MDVCENFYLLTGTHITIVNMQSNASVIKVLIYNQFGYKGNKTTCIT